MNLFTRLLGIRQKPFSIPEALYGPIQTMAEKEGVSPGELLARILSEAEKKRQASDSLPGRWRTLTPRQQQVVFLICQDLSCQEIAVKMGISEETVKNHQRIAMGKLNLRGRYLLKQALEGFDFAPWA